MAKKTAVKEPEVDEDEDLELEDLDEDVEEEKPAKKGGAAQEVTFGVRDLCDYVNKKFGKSYSPREMRTLIRKLARDGSNRVNREIIPGNRTRYDWSGVDDPEVKAIIKAVKGGEIEASKKEALDKLKEQKAKKQAAEGTTKTKKGKKATKQKVVEPEEDEVDDLEDLEDDDDE